MGKGTLKTRLDKASRGQLDVLAERREAREVEVKEIEISDLHQRLENSARELAAARRQAEEGARSDARALKEATQVIATMEKQHEETLAEAAAGQVACKRLQQQLEDATGAGTAVHRLRELESEVEAAKSKADLLLEQLGDKSTERRIAETKLEEMTDRCEKIEEKFVKLECDQDTLRGTLNGSQSNVRSLEREKAELSATCSQLTAQVATTAAAAQQAKLQWDLTAEARQKEHDAALKREKSRADEAEKAVRCAIIRAEEAELDLQQAEVQADEAEDELYTEWQRADKLLTKTESLTAELARAVAEVRTLKDEVTKLNKALKTKNEKSFQHERDLTSAREAARLAQQKFQDLRALLNLTAEQTPVDARAMNLFRLESGGRSVWRYIGDLGTSRMLDRDRIKTLEGTLAFVDRKLHAQKQCPPRPSVEISTQTSTPLAPLIDDQQLIEEETVRAELHKQAVKVSAELEREKELNTELQARLTAFEAVAADHLSSTPAPSGKADSVTAVSSNSDFLIQKLTRTVTAMHAEIQGLNTQISELRSENMELLLRLGGMEDRV